MKKKTIKFKKKKDGKRDTLYIGELPGKTWKERKSIPSRKKQFTLPYIKNIIQIIV